MLAGVAALLQGRAREKLSPDEIEALLKAGAHDMAAPGYDFDTGYGFVDARAALRWLRRSEF